MAVYFGEDSGRHLSTESPIWAVPIKVTPIGGMTWQQAYGSTKSANLVIVEQATKHLLNYALHIRRQLTGQKIAYWGHGKNFQTTNPRSLQERIKRLFSLYVDWWFVYNRLSLDVVQEIGFPRSKITNVENAIDTQNLKRLRSSLSDSSVKLVLSDLGITSQNVVIYTGGLYKEKRIRFLLESCDYLRARIKDFHILILGQGPDENLVTQAASSRDWIHFVGPKGDADKVPYWAISKLSLMPGLVGLGVLDSFALGVPIVTTAYPYHSPEIDYLKHGVNGWIVKNWNNPANYAEEVIELMLDEHLRQKLVEHGKSDSDYYTVENMANKFYLGIKGALRL